MRQKKQRNKYLDELGIPIDEYGTNSIVNNDRKTQHYWKKQREEYGFDSRECYDVGHTFVEWFYSHLKMYLDDALKMVDLTDDLDMIVFQDKKYTIEEAVEYMIYNLGRALTINDEWDMEYHECVHNAILMWAEAYPAVWW